MVEAKVGHDANVSAEGGRCKGQTNGRGSSYVTKHIQMMVSAWEVRGKSVHEQEF